MFELHEHLHLLFETHAGPECYMMLLRIDTSNWTEFDNVFEVAHLLW